ncbi:alpha/beta fold hydrolase [Marinobacter sp.]|uniref:alpha/beta fold hydrolase n=1 Tax=Marinobacter sp. TaxID=50741 RepID=UPI00356A56D2
MNWILLRGLTRERAHWGDFRERLEEAFPRHRFHVLDLPGTGEHFHEVSPATIAGIRRKVQASAEPITGPIGLLGLSMGGMVALDWAQAAPDRVRQLVLVNASTGFSPPWQRMKPETLGRVLALMWQRDVQKRERAILELTSNRPVTDTLQRRWFEIQRRRPVSLRTTLAQLRAAARYRPGSSAPAARALLLASAGDRIVNWQCSRRLADRWSWPLLVHPDAGHDLPLDDPQWVIRQLGCELPNRPVESPVEPSLP